jgi:tetratricopeptide (TPR) repeat protein
LAAAIETAETEITSNARLNLGDSLVALGRFADADDHYQAVERVVRNPRPQDRWMLWRYAQHLLHSVGELHLVLGNVGAAHAYADECLSSAKTTGSVKNIVKARRLRGQALLGEGDLPSADAELTGAIETARQLGNPPQLWKTLMAVGDLRRAQGRPAEAQAVYRDAAHVINEVAAHLPDEALRETLELHARAADRQARSA